MGQKQSTAAPCTMSWWYDRCGQEHDVDGHHHPLGAENSQSRNLPTCSSKSGLSKTIKSSPLRSISPGRMRSPSSHEELPPWQEQDVDGQHPLGAENPQEHDGDAGSRKSSLRKSSPLRNSSPGRMRSPSSPEELPQWQQPSSDEEFEKTVTVRGSHFSKPQRYAGSNNNGGGKGGGRW